MKVLLNTIKDVEMFTKLATGLMSDIDVCSGKYLVNGKSLMGLFSLDLSKPIEVIVHEVVPSEAAQFEKALENVGCIVKN